MAVSAHLSAGALTVILLGSIAVLSAFVTWLYRILCSKHDEQYDYEDEKLDNLSFNEEVRSSYQQQRQVPSYWQKPTIEADNESRGTLSTCMGGAHSDTESKTSSRRGSRSSIMGPHSSEWPHYGTTGIPSIEICHQQQRSLSGQFYGATNSKGSSPTSSARPSFSSTVNDMPVSPKEEHGTATFQLKYEQMTGSLQLTVDSCQLSLSDNDSKAELPSSFIEVQFLPPCHLSKVRTRLIPHNDHPHFDETFQWNDVSTHHLKHLSVHMKLFRMDRYSHESMAAEAICPLQNLDLHMGHSVLVTKVLKCPHFMYPSNECSGEVLISFCYHPDVNKISLSVQKARNLPKRPTTGLPGNPFIKVTVKFSDQRLFRGCTRCKMRTMRPVYNETFAFDLPSVDLDVLQRFLDIKCFIYSRDCEGLSVIPTTSTNDSLNTNSSMDIQFCDQVIGYVALNANKSNVLTNRTSINPSSVSCFPTDIPLSPYQQQVGLDTRRKWLEVFKHPGKNVTHWYPVVSCRDY